MQGEILKALESTHSMSSDKPIRILGGGGINWETMHTHIAHYRLLRGVPCAVH